MEAGLLLISLGTALSSAADLSGSAPGPADWACEHEVYCDSREGGLLHAVQTAAIFPDSKTFVDMPMKFKKETVLKKFKNLPNHNNDTINLFVAENFADPGAELETVDPADWVETPEFLARIEDDGLRELARKMNSIWRNLTRRVGWSRQEVEARSSLIFLQHPFVVPGGRFRELYYWDSYWTLKGLLLSQMFDTAKGMIQNFKSLVGSLGHIPNGNRVYYSKRSQPPLFAQMVQDYLDATADPVHAREFMAEVVDQLEDEWMFWESRQVEVEAGGGLHLLARYRVEGGGPRPESYREDLELAAKLPEAERAAWYGHMKAGAESGWDYSSRWFVGNVSGPSEDELLSVRTGDIVPVDLNSFLCRNAQIIAGILTRLERPEKAAVYTEKRDRLVKAIKAVLYDEDDGLWYDYNVVTKQPTRRFYPSNLSPLYTACSHPDIDMNRTMAAILTLKETLLQPGGVPSSDTESGQQWDWPNVWAPLVEMTVMALERTGTGEGSALARQLAGAFLGNVLRSEASTGGIYEKYNCTGAGRPGGGGEYGVQQGFGWTNGVSLSLLARYPDLTSACPSSFGPSGFLLGLIVFLLKT